MEVKVSKIGKIIGKIKIPPDKSISHRAIILGSIACGTTKIHNFLKAKDTFSTVKCMRALGIEIDMDNSTCIIKGGTLTEPEDVLDAENSGTTARLLLGLLAGQSFFSVITGDASLRRRPMDRVILPLEGMGASLYGREDNKYLPVGIKGTKLHGIHHTLKVASAQVKSAIILAGLFANGTTYIKEPILTRDHTERMIKYMGGKIEKLGDTILIEGNQKLQGREIFLPSDISSASYFIALATLLPDSEIILPNVGINPTRTGIIKILNAMGAKIEISNKRIISNEPLADIKVLSSQLKGIEIGGDDIPKVIDELPLIAVIATQAEGVTIVRDAKELRIKESDRISSIVQELSILGANIEEREDGFKVTGPTQIKGGICDSHGDHRIAMSLIVAGCICDSETIIKGAECIDISFPGFVDIIKNYENRC